MNDTISFKYRLVAALLHGLGKIPIVVVLVFLSTTSPIESIVEVRLSQIEFILLFDGFVVGLPLIFAQPIVSLILWQIIKRWHPFVDVAGKIAVNRSVNALVAMSLCFLLVFAIFGKNTTLTVVILAIVYAIAIGYFIDAAIASTFALRGKVFRNRFIHDFIKVDR